MPHLLIATGNPGKTSEYERLLAPLPVTLCTPRDLGLALKIQESGQTYSENARIKAIAYQRASGLWALADDSGLEVDALEGGPGLRSARFGRPLADDAERCQLLLLELSAVPWAQRTARFRCAIVLALPIGEIYHAEGCCEGLIALEPVGDRGFGYDPIFYLPDHGQTMSQLSPEVKNRISHRARAAQEMLSILKQLLAGPTTAAGES